MKISEKQIRRERASTAAQAYQQKTGKGPGTCGYADTFFAAYFGHPLASSKSIQTEVLEQFEALLDRVAEIDAGIFTYTTALHRLAPRKVGIAR